MPAAAALTLAGARDRLRGARKNVASTLHYTARVLCKDSTRRINHGVAQLTQPVEVIFHDEMTKAKKREHFFKVHRIFLVFDGYRETLIKMWEVFVSADFAEHTEFTNSQDLSPFQMQLDNVVGKALFKYMASFVGALHRVHVQYQCCFPLKFLQLLDEDATRRELAFEFCKQSWSCLQKLERLAADNGQVRIMLKDLGFPSMPWVRRISTGLDKVSIKDPLPQWLGEDFQDFGNSFFGTPAVGNMFNKASAIKNTTITGR